MSKDKVWQRIRTEAADVTEREPALSKLLKECVLDRVSLEEALSYSLARKMSRHALPEQILRDIFIEILTKNPDVVDQIRNDIKAVLERDPACNDFLTPLLYLKGFIAISAYRMSHSLWKENRKELAHYLQSIISEEFAVDIHPAARIGSGIMLDHATSFVAGETSVIDDNVSILHEVTLGGTGKEHGDRHPKIRSGVLLSAGAKIIGNVEVGEGAWVGAGSVVLNDVPAHTTVAGVPAKKVGNPRKQSPALEMDQQKYQFYDI